MGANNIHGAETGKALGDPIAANTMLKELDLSAQKVGTYGTALDAAFAKEFAIGVGANGAMVKLLMGSNNICAEGGKALAEALKNNPVMQELNISDNNLGWNSSNKQDMSGVIAISDAIPTMGALTSLNLANNQIFCMGAQHVADVLSQCK